MYIVQIKVTDLLFHPLVLELLLLVEDDQLKKSEDHKGNKESKDAGVQNKSLKTENLLTLCKTKIASLGINPYRRLATPEEAFICHVEVDEARSIDV